MSAQALRLDLDPIPVPVAAIACSLRLRPGDPAYVMLEAFAAALEDDEDDEKGEDYEWVEWPDVDWDQAEVSEPEEGLTGWGSPPDDN